MGRNEYGISGQLHIFAHFKHLMVLLRCKILQGFIFTPYQRHVAYRDMKVRFFKVKTLVNDAFNKNKGNIGHILGFISLLYKGGNGITGKFSWRYEAKWNILPSYLSCTRC